MHLGRMTKNHHLKYIQFVLLLLKMYIENILCSVINQNFFLCRQEFDTTSVVKSICFSWRGLPVSRRETQLPFLLAFCSSECIYLYFQFFQFFKYMFGNLNDQLSVAKTITWPDSFAAARAFLSLLCFHSSFAFHPVITNPLYLKVSQYSTRLDVSLLD